MNGDGSLRLRHRVRIGPAIAAILVNALIGFALITGLRVAPLLRSVADDASLALFNLRPPLKEPPKPVQRAEPVRKKAGGGSKPAPPGPQKPDVKAAPVVAPPAAVVMPTPPLPAAPPPSGANAGSGSVGQGGSGTGGGGGEGSGSGDDGGSGGTFSPARQTGGRFRNSDFPDSVRGTGPLKIGVRYAIGPTGRVDRCEVIETSGYPEVDAMTCRIIMERYSFRPARDPSGYAVTEVREEDYRWKVR